MPDPDSSFAVKFTACRFHVRKRFKVTNSTPQANNSEATTVREKSQEFVSRRNRAISADKSSPTYV